MGLKVNDLAKFAPPKGTKGRLLLRLLLIGEQVGPVEAFYRLNLPTLAARVSELRKLGWPVRTIEMPHPTLANEDVTYYLLDQHFRSWLSAHPGASPKDYPDSDGRGKFTDRGEVTQV